MSRGGTLSLAAEVTYAIEREDALDRQVEALTHAYVEADDEGAAFLRVTAERDSLREVAEAAVDFVKDGVAPRHTRLVEALRKAGSDV